MDFSTIHIEDKEYPPLLEEIEGAPSPLYIRGSLLDVDLPAVAIVGTRKATKDGKELARKTVIGRVGQPDEIARSILFLADGVQSGFITGEGLVIDGGATARLSTE